MPSDSNKKLSILYVLKVLQEYSDENHMLKQQEIADKIENIYGLRCERKTIANNIDNLIDFGYDIIKTTKNGCYLASREFETSEISFLIDAIFSCRSIGSKQARELAKKLSNILSFYERKTYNYVYKTEEIARTNNKQIFYNIDTIHRAIDENKQISFIYNDYDTDGNLVPRKQKPFIINPYFLVNNLGNYYLVCNNNYFDKISNFRIAEITDIKILDTKIKPVTKLVGYENGLDIAKYINSNIYMFGDKHIKVKLKIDNIYMVGQVKKWFGSKINIKQEGSAFYGSLITSEMSIIYWALQYCENIEIVEPQSTREKIKNIAMQLVKKYK